MDEKKLSPLLSRLAAGDRDAVAAIFQEARAPLLSFFYRLSRSMDVAEDLLQNTFLSLWRYRVAYGGVDSARGYLYRVALHEWHRVLERGRRRSGLADPLAEEPSDPIMKSPTEEIETSELASRVRRAIEALPTAQREAFVLHRFEGMSCREIADTTGESVKTIESRIRLALHKLSERLKIRGGAA